MLSNALADLCASRIDRPAFVDDLVAETDGDADVRAVLYKKALVEYGNARAPRCLGSCGCGCSCVRNWKEQLGKTNEEFIVIVIVFEFLSLSDCWSLLLRAFQGIITVQL